MVLQPADFPATISESLSPKNQLESKLIFHLEAACRINPVFGFRHEHNCSGVCGQ